MKRICVYCGSSNGSENIYENQTIKLGETLAKLKIELVYGGASVGLMGILANSVLKNKGKVIGVLPVFLSNVEISHKKLTQLILVETMHERKSKMNELSDGVIMLPGGYGTLEEFFEMLTWAQLGLHKKPIAILNINGFYDDLIELIMKMASNGFLKEENKEMIIVSKNIDELIEKMKNYSAPTTGKWINKKL